MLLDRHRALSRARATGLAVSAGLALWACGDDLCPGPTQAGLCRVLRVDGAAPGDELGFRFGAPLDLDGDGRQDVAAGARRVGARDVGAAGAWSLAGAPLGRWDGAIAEGLFGHFTLPVPDLDGDGAADLVISAPSAVVDGLPVGVVEAVALDGRRLWRAVGRPGDGLGWHLARAGDHDGDGVEDVWAGAPSSPGTTHVYLLAGRDGAVLGAYASPDPGDRLGWHVAAIADLDADGADDLAIGAPGALVGGVQRGRVHLVSGRTLAPLRVLTGDQPGRAWGIMLAALDDLDGDGAPELAVGGLDSATTTSPAPEEVHVVSGATGARLRVLVGREPDELYGRMLARLDDVDGDGAADLAIGAPWWRGRDGRVEVRSARTLALLAELEGDEGGWLGWHATAAPGPGLLVSQLHARRDAGAVELWVGW